MAVDVNELARRYEALRTERSGWDAAWRSLAELFLPCRWRSDTDTTAHQSPKLNGRLVNSAGVLAMRTLAAGMQGGMTSPVRPWFRLTTKGDDIAGMPGLNAWLEEVTSRMQRVLHESNFYNAVHGLYADLGTFGTGLLIETADEDGIHFHLIRAGEYVLDVNGRNEVDTFFRRLNMTARQSACRMPSGTSPGGKRGRAAWCASTLSTAFSRVVMPLAGWAGKTSPLPRFTGCKLRVGAASPASCPRAVLIRFRPMRRAGT